MKKLLVIKLLSLLFLNPVFCQEDEGKILDMDILGTTSHYMVLGFEDTVSLDVEFYIQEIKYGPDTFTEFCYYHNDDIGGCFDILEAHDKGFGISSMKVKGVAGFVYVDFYKNPDNPEVFEYVLFKETQVMPKIRDRYVLFF